MSIASSQQANVTFDDICNMVRMRSVEQIQEGRYYVVLNLAEAETVRANMHLRDKVISQHSAALALRTCQQNTLLDSAGTYSPAKKFQALTAQQCLRFINSQMWYQEAELSALLQAVQDNSCKERQVFFVKMGSFDSHSSLKDQVALRFTSGLFIRWLDDYPRLETAGFLSVAFVGIRLLLHVMLPSLNQPDWLTLLAELILFVWGFSVRSIEALDHAG